MTRGAIGRYAWRVLVGLDVAANALTGGHPRETITDRMRYDDSWFARNVLRHFCPTTPCGTRPPRPDRTA